MKKTKYLLKNNKITYKEFYIFSTIVLTIFVLVPLILTNKIISIVDFTATGNIGDTIGGITAPFLSIIGSILIYLAFKEQIRANDLIQKQYTKQEFENKLFKLIDIYRENVSRMKFKSRESGKEYQDKSVFPILYNHFRKLKKEVEVFVSEKNISTINLITEEYKHELENKNTSANIENWIILELSYIIFFFGVGLKGRSNIKSLLHNKYDSIIIGELINYLTYKPAYLAHDNIHFQEWEKKFPGLQKFDAPVNAKFDKYYNGQQNTLGHYYRHIFMIINYINKNTDLKYLEKWDDAKLLRIQLSNHEQIFFYLNSISLLGRDWELSHIVNTNLDIENKRLITKYDLIKNIPISEINSLRINEFYPHQEYENSIEDIGSYRRNLNEKIYN